MINNVPRWLQLAVEFDGDNLKPIPQPSQILNDNGISVVFRGAYADGDGIIFKRSIPYLTENEWYCLDTLRRTGFVPQALRWDKYTIQIQDLGQSEHITNRDLFMSYKYDLLDTLQRYGIKHGDLTTANVIVKNNHPFVIDWAESRWGSDPRPQKRPEGDRYWIENTWEMLLNE